MLQCLMEMRIEEDLSKVILQNITITIKIPHLTAGRLITASLRCVNLATQVSGTPTDREVQISPLKYQYLNKAKF